ncbi:MAG TPA: hypothetical protein VFX21_05485 [Acidimicrobiia bacterium]|nr:hypothetical protein [Acidimicrobiia bacterium]
MSARSGAHASGDDARYPFELWLTCPDCGDIVVPAKSCDVYLDLSHDRHLVAYRCPRCRRRGTCPLDDEHVAWLMERGHAVRVLTVAAELHEPRPGGPAFQWDDILAFHEMLSDGPMRLP